jgi:hypothetical protein
LREDTVSAKRRSVPKVQASLTGEATVRFDWVGPGIVIIVDPARKQVTVYPKGYDVIAKGTGPTPPKPPVFRLVEFGPAPAAASSRTASRKTAKKAAKKAAPKKKVQKKGATAALPPRLRAPAKGTGPTLPKPPLAGSPDGND